MGTSQDSHDALRFGALVESRMDKAERRAAGVHYTTEANILAVLNSALLDRLRAELEAARGSRTKLESLLVELTEIRVFDPACGGGNFLVVAYRELRRIELEAVHAWTAETHAIWPLRVDVDQLAGIEIDEFAARMAEAALGHTDALENRRAAVELGPAYVRGPLRAAPTIVNGNALVLDWTDIVAPRRFVHVVGNPPFIGKKEQTNEQKADMRRVIPGAKGMGKLDYVAAWFMKAARYAAHDPAVSVAFVATSSVTQGEQVGVLWTALFAQGVKINFAHRTFPWASETEGKAAVHCVIIGFGHGDTNPKTIVEYDASTGEPRTSRAGFINGYLVDGPHVCLRDRANPIGDGPKVTYGSFALDDGRYTLSPRERADLMKACPAAEPFIRPFVGGNELIHAKARFCLWLVDATPEELAPLPEIAARVAHVQAWRSRSDRPETRALAATPLRFAEIRQPTTKYLAFPTLSSERRPYIPIDFLDPCVIASNQVYVFEGATLYHFGVLTSNAHMTWVRAVSGRLESRYRYSASIVYNNFPWPDPSPEQHEAIADKAQAVLDVRAAHPNATLGQLYDRRTMPPDLVEAHRGLDEAVDAAYRIAMHETEAERAAVLLALHHHELATAQRLR